METRTSRLIFPLAGLTYADCVSVAGMNKRRAARRLGVSEHHFLVTINRLGMGELYPDVRPRPTCVSAKDIQQVAAEGYTRRDAAYLLGISYTYLKDLVKRWDLAGCFVDRNTAKSIAQKGYCNQGGNRG